MMDSELHRQLARWGARSAEQADTQASTAQEQTAGQQAKTDTAGQALRPVTVRFSGEAWEAIRDTAAENGVSMAELVRMAVAGNLSRYLGDIRIIDQQQAAEIKKAITALCDTVSRTETELHRIGINYNQEVRLKQIERKYGDMRYSSTATFMRKAEEIAKVKNDSANLSKEELDALLTRYEQATKQVGEVLCRILT